MNLWKLIEINNMDFKIRNTNDLKRLMDYIEKQAQDSLRLVALEVEKMMKQYVIDNLYNNYTPKDYARSYNYINSLTIKKVYKNSKGELETEIFFDPNKIYSREVHDRYWNQHMSLNGSTTWDGVPINELLPVWMEKGVSSSKWSHKGIHVVDNILKKLDNDKQFKKMMEDELRKKGFKIE